MTTIEPPTAQLRLHGRLGTLAIVFMVLAAAAPLTVVGSIIPIGILLGNGPGFPVMFLVATGVLVLFAVGMLRMSEALPRAGSFFTFIAHGLGRVPGTSAAMVAILTYSTVQISVFAYFGATISSSIDLLGGPSIPWWVFTAVSLALVGLLGYRRLDFSSTVLIVLLAAETLIVIVLGLAVLSRGGAESVTFAAFGLDTILSGSPALGLMFAVAGFIGFESTVVYRDEVKDPVRTIRRATYASAVGVGVFYAFAAWITVVGFGADAVQGAVGENPTTVLARLTETYLGPVGSLIVSVLFLGSMFAAVLSLHNVLARYHHGMAIAGVLPRSLAAVHDRFGSPYRASLTQTLTAGVVLAVFAVAGVAPELVFAWLAGIGTLAIIVLMAVTALGIVVFFVRRGEVGWSTVIAPALGGIGLAVAACLIVANFPLLVGDVDADGAPVFGTLSVSLLAIIVAAAVAGAVWAVMLRSRRPDRYTRIISQLEEVDHR